MSEKPLFSKPASLYRAMARCLVILLMLPGVSLYAQVGGDPPSETGPTVVRTTSPEATGAQAGDLPAAAPIGMGVAGAAGILSEEGDGKMFEGSADVATGAAVAAISSAISFQGRLDENEFGANGNYDFRFRLFDDPAAGTQAGEVFANSVAVENGLFNVLLDFGSDAFAGEALWLEIGVRPTGGGAYETIAPREPLTAAPLALSLPNVTTDPTTGYVSVGDGTQLSVYHHFGINREYEGWVGMYITGGGPSARPYYGYATDDEGSFDHAWTEYNGSADEWRVYVQDNNVFSVGDDGDVGQPAAASGLVKAAAYVECWNDANFLTLYSSFNNVNSTPVAVATGPTQGECYVDFGFNLSNRFYSATAVQPGAARGVTCDVDVSDSERLRCMRWRVNEGATEGWGGRIMVTVY